MSSASLAAIRENDAGRNVTAPPTEIAIVLPALNEEKAVGYVLDRIQEALKGRDYKVILVDGNSTDGTAKIAREKGAIVVHQRQKGYGDALQTGFEYAYGKIEALVTVMMDSDGTYDPKDIPRLVDPVIFNEADIVIGNRFKGMERGAMSRTNRIGNHLISWAARKILKIRVCDTQSGFRALNTKIIHKLELSAEGMPFAIEMLGEARRADSRILEIPISYRRRIGETKLNPFKDGFKISAVILRMARDYQPLLFFGGAGALFILGGVLSGARVVIEYLTTGEITHLASVTLSALLTLTGLQLFFIALLADMIKSIKKHIREG